MINIVDWNHRRPCKRTCRNITSVQCNLRNFLSHKRVGDKFQTYRVPLIENSGLRFWNPDFGFCNKTRNPKRILRPKNPSQGRFSIKKFKSKFRRFPPFTIPKTICKTVLLNSGMAKRSKNVSIYLCGAIQLTRPDTTIFERAKCAYQ